ncbi:hypothetical protein [Arthrobacter sp. 3Tela_A]|uniref:hypothetical protein n=1 Tax=Arthrobacter sp. 3Tela_A TaxID=3093743 RepID=UPI003BB5DEE4
MTTPQSLKVIVRRWYLVVSGILFTAVLCWGASQVVPPSYDAQGSMVLMPPPAAVGDEGNPYLQLGGMSEALDVLVRQANAPAVRDRVLEAYPSATYTIEPDRSTSGSIVVVQATAETEAESLTVLDQAMETLPAVLTRMQDELAVIPVQRIDIMPVVVDAEATLNSKQTLQMLAVTVVVGLSGTLMFTALADGLLLARAGRTETPAAESRHRRGAGADGPDPHPPTRAGSRRATPAAPAASAAPAAAEKHGTTDPLVGEDARAR